MLILQLGFLFLTFQTEEVSPPTETAPAPEPVSEEFKTNSGEEFKDPFAETPAPQPQTQPQPLTPVGSSPVTPAPAPPSPPAQTFPTPTPTPAPVIANPPAPPSVPEVPNTFEFPKPLEPTGPRTQDLDPVRQLSEGTKVGTWNAQMEVGPALNLNRRPNQFQFEVEGGYRLTDRWELAGIVSVRMRKDRILGFFFMPYYNWRLTENYKSYRIDFRAGLGTGWVFRGFKGSTYQVGYFPIRTAGGFLFYPSKRWAFIAGLDIETYLFRIDSDGKTANEMGHKKGPLAQFIPSVGARYEF